MQTRAILFTGVDSASVGTVTIPEPGPGEVRIQTAYSCVSPGTELRCLAGKQQGSPPYPYVPGYALTGTIAACGEGVTLAVGSRVFAGGTQHVSGANRLWGGHIAHAVVHESRVVPVPEGVSLQNAALSALAAIAYHGRRTTNAWYYYVGGNVVVVGLGAIGQFAARVWKSNKTKVVGVDRSQARVSYLRASGIVAVVSTESLAEVIQPLFPEGVDVVVDATGVPAVLPEAIQLLNTPPFDNEEILARPLYIVQGSYPDTFTVPYGEAFMREVAIVLPRDRQIRDVELVLHGMKEGTLNVSGLADAVRLPEQAQAAYNELQNADTGPITILFDWQPAP